MLLESSGESNAHPAHGGFCTPTRFREVLCCQETVLSARASNVAEGDPHQAAVAARAPEPGRTSKSDSTHWVTEHTREGESCDRAESEEHKNRVTIPAPWFRPCSVSEA